MNIIKRKFSSDQRDLDYHLSKIHYCQVFLDMGII